MDAKINEQVKNKKQDNLITAEIRYKMTAKGYDDHRILWSGQLCGPAG